MSHAITVSDVLFIAGLLFGTAAVSVALIAILWAIAQSFKD